MNRGQTMTETNAHPVDRAVHDLQSMHTGDHVEVWDRGVLRYCGRVEEAAPALKVMWIREAWTGERKMIAADDYCLRSC